MSELPGPVPGNPKSNSTLPFLLTENLNAVILNHLPARYQTGRRRSKSKSKVLPPGVEDLTSLKTSFSLWDGVRELQRHRWQTSDLQYAVLAFLALFSLWIAPSAPMIKTFALLGSAWLLLMPATGQFFRPSMMIWIWLLYFFCSR